MATNNQLLLDAIIKQEMEGHAENISLNDFFKFYSALQILKEKALSYDEINEGITERNNDGGVDSIYLFVNGKLVKEADLANICKTNIDIEFVLIQSKYENAFLEEPLRKSSRLCRNLLDLNFNYESDAGQYNEQVLSAFELFKNAYVGLITKKPKLRVNVYYASKSVEINPNVEKQAASLEDDISAKLPGSEAKVHFLCAEKLVKMAQEKPTNVSYLKKTEAPLSTSDQVFMALTNLSDCFDRATREDE